MTEDSEVEEVSEDAVEARHRNDDATVERLVNENIKLAQYFANKAIHLDPDEALSRALRGLLEAAQRFDPSRGKFGTYAAYQIKSHIQRITREQQAKRRGGEFFKVSLQDHLDDEGRELGELVADPNADPLRSIEDDNNSAFIAEALSQVDARTAEIMRRRFGVGGDEETLEQIGQSLGVTRERIRQLERKGLRRLGVIVKQLKKQKETKELLEGARAELRIQQKGR